MKDSFRASDYPARIGGDEFAVIMTEAALYQVKEHGRSRGMAYKSGFV